MALLGTNTLVTLNDELQLFCNEHKQIQRYEFEFEEQLENFSTEGKTFPLVFASPVTFGKNGQTDLHTIRIHVLTRINRDRDNTLFNVSDTSLILNDIIKYWNSSNRQSEILVLNDPIGIPVNNSQLDYLQGYYADFDFELKSYSKCDIPIPDGTPVIIGTQSYIEPYLTCPSLADCSTFTQSIGNLQDQIDNLDAEKWTFGVVLDDTELDFTRNDGSTYSVDLQPLITNLENDLTIAENNILLNKNAIIVNQNNISTNTSDIADLENDLLNYLPLAGGTMSGNIDFITGNKITSNDSYLDLAAYSTANVIHLSTDGADYADAGIYIDSDNITEWYNYNQNKTIRLTSYQTILDINDGSIEMNRDLDVDGKIIKSVYAENPTSTVISFTEPEIYNSRTTPGTGNITDDLTDAKIGIVQKIYHNDSSTPTVPAGWVLLGSNTYVTNELNDIYCEYVGGTTVEYWIVQEN